MGRKSISADLPNSNGNDTLENEKRASFFIGEETKPARIVGPNDEEIFLDEVVIPPDGGWGWVIVFASFLSNMVVDGTVFSFGILLNPIHEASGGTIPISTIAWVGSLATGFYFLAGPVVSAVANKFGFRVVAISGSIMASLSLLVAYFFCREGPVMIVLFIFYGVIGGVGFGMIYVPAVIAVGFYFDNKRALATGIAICGSGIGTFIFPPLMNFIIEKYQWQGALLFQSGVILFCIFFGMLYRPLEPTKVVPDMNRRKSAISSIGSPDGTPLLQRIKKAREMEKWDSVNSFATSNETIDAERDPRAKAERLYNRVRKSSLGSMQGPGGAILPHKRMSVPESLNENSMTLTVPQGPPRGKSFVGFPLPDLKEEDDHFEDHSRENSPADEDNDNDKTKQQEIEKDRNENNALQVNRNNSTFITKIGSSILAIDEMTNSRILRVASSKASLSKPMYRDDIFYSGSLMRIPQYANNVNRVMTSAEWTAAVTSVPPGAETDPKDDDVDGDDSPSSCCSSGVLQKMLDVSLLVSPTFLILSISGFFTMLGLFVPFIYLKGVATESVGLNVSLATMLVSIIGIANTAGRVVSGWIADRPQINVLFLNNLSITIIGLSTAAVPFLNSFNALVGFACVFGLAMACFASLRSILLVELLGLEKLTNAFGLTLLFQGIASILGTPLAGFLYEATGAYNIPFYVAGSFIVISGVMCYPLNAIKRWETNREKRKEKEKQALTI